MKKEELMAWSYILEFVMERAEFITLERTTLPPEPERWAIRDGSRCLSKLKHEFCYEPSPSERKDKHFKEFRFNSVQEAIDYWTEHGKEIER